MYCQSNNWWRFRKILWPSQNIWTLRPKSYLKCLKSIYFAKKRSTMLTKKAMYFYNMKKISWNLNTYCDLTSFEVKKLHVLAQFFLFFFRQLVFLVALQNHYMQKVTWDHCRCPFSQGWHLKKKAILGVLRSIC